MCRKLGKGHPDYINRVENYYEVGDDGVKRMRRTYAGRRICEHHGTNVLNAMTDYRDKVWSWFPNRSEDTILKSTAAKTRMMRHLNRCCNHGQTRFGKALRQHLARNNVTRLGDLRQP